MTDCLKIPQIPTAYSLKTSLNCPLHQKSLKITLFTNNYLKNLNLFWEFPDFLGLANKFKIISPVLYLETCFLPRSHTSRNVCFTGRETRCTASCCPSTTATETTQCPPSAACSPVSYSASGATSRSVKVDTYGTVA